MLQAWAECGRSAPRWQRPMPPVQWISATPLAAARAALRCDPESLRPLEQEAQEGQRRIRSASTTMDFSEPLPIDAALPELTAALRVAQRRGAGRAARRRQDHAGAARAGAGALGEGQENPRARAAPARRPRRRRAHGVDAGRGGRRDRRAIACASARRSRARPASRSSPKASSRASSSTIPRSPASPPCCSTSSTSARSTPISAWRWRATCSRACARTSSSWSCRRRSTARGSASCCSARRRLIESVGRAFPVETRYLGRDARVPIERQVADAIVRALARRCRLAAGLPARRRRDPPHRDAAARAHRRSHDRHRGALRRARSRGRRTARSRRRRPAAARWCWRPRSRRPR